MPGPARTANDFWDKFRDVPWITLPNASIIYVCMIRSISVEWTAALADWPTVRPSDPIWRSLPRRLSRAVQWCHHEVILVSGHHDSLDDYRLPSRLVTSQKREHFERLYFVKFV